VSFDGGKRGRECEGRRRSNFIVITRTRGYCNICKGEGRRTGYTVGVLRYIGIVLLILKMSQPHRAFHRGVNKYSMEVSPCRLAFWEFRPSGFQEPAFTRLHLHSLLSKTTT
jgi:hypothetical protein